MHRAISLARLWNVLFGRKRPVSPVLVVYIECNVAQSPTDILEWVILSQILLVSAYAFADMKALKTVFSKL